MKRFYVIEGESCWIVMDRELMRWRDRIPKSRLDGEQAARQLCDRLNQWRAQNQELDRLIAENDAIVAAWKETHKNYPCERCGSRENVKIDCYGSLARLRCFCASCWSAL